jgi:hypothetical protein
LGLSVCFHSENLLWTTTFELLISPKALEKTLCEITYLIIASP